LVPCRPDLAEVDAAGQIHSVAGDKVGQLAVPYHNERWGNAVRWTEPGIITFFAREEPGCFKQFTPTGRIISEVEQPVPAPIIGTGWLREGDEMVSFAPSGSENRSRRNWLVKWDASGRGKSIPFKTHQKSDQLNDPVVGWNATKNWFSIPSTTGVRTFDLSGKEVSHLEPEQFLSQATWSPDGRHLATASHYASNELCIYTGEKVTKIPVELDDRSCLRWTRDAKQLLVSFRQSYHQSEQHKVVTIADKSVREFTSRCEQPLSPLGTWTVIATKDSFAFHGIDGAKREIKFDVPDRYDSYQCHWKDDESKVGIVITNWGSKQSETFIYDFAKESLTKLDTTIAARDLIWFGNSWAGMTGNEMVYRSDNDGSGGRVALPNRAFNYVFARGRLISAGQADCNPFSRDHRYMSVILNSYTGAERKAGGNLCLVDMREQKVAWTGIVFNDGQRAVLGDSGKLLVAPEEKIDRYLSYQISYPHPNGGTTRIVPLSQLQFAARIGLSRPQQIMQWVLDLGGTLKVGNDQQEITASELADARELPDVSSCIGVDLTGSRQVTRNNLDDLRLLEDLRHVRLGNVELEDWDFSFLSKLNDLETLDLSGSDATNRIGLLLPAGLVSLNLSNTDVDDLLLYDLATQDALRQLDLSGTKVTNEAVNRLRDQLPNCEIVLSNRLQRGSLGQSSDDAMVAKLDAIDWQPGASQKLDGYASTPTDLPGIKPGTWQVMTKYPHTIGNGSVSPNATYLALWYDKDSDPFVRIMERRTGRLVGMVKHMSRANFGDLTWAPDESKFIAWDLVGGDYQASIYRWSTKLRGQHFGWNPDGTRILIVGEKTMEQRSPDGKLIRSFVSPLHGFNTAPHLLNPLWSPTGKKFTGVDDGKIYVYNADGGEPTHTINADGIDRAGVIWHPSEDKLLTSDGRFWDMSGNHIQFGLDQLHEQILAFSPDGQFFVTNHGEVRDLTDRVVATLDVSQLGYIQAQDVRWFKEDEITFVSFRTRGPGYSAEYSPSGTRLAEYDHPAPIVQHSMSWNPSEDNFVSVAGLTNFGSNVRERIFRWGVEPSQISSVVRLDSLTTPPAAISPDGSRYVLPRDNGPTSIFDRTGKKQYQLNIGYSGNLCSWSPDGSQLAIAQTSPVSECAVEVFQGEDKVCRFAGHAKGVRSLSWSPNGKLLCVCDGTGKVTVWGIKKADTPVFEKVGDVAYHRDNYQYDWLFDKALPCWSPDGSWLAIPTTEAVVLVSPTGEDEITLPWTENEFGTIWWHPDGQRLIAGRVLFDIPEKAKTAIRDIKQPFLFVRWAKGDAFTGVTHRQVGFWTSASAEPTMIGVPRFSRPGPANVLLTSRGVNSRRVSKTNRYLTHPLSVSRAQYAESGDLCLIDLQEQTHKWTGIAFSDGNRVQIEPTGRVVHCPKESDKYLCYVVTGVGDRIIALSQAEFASRIGLASERRLLLQLMDMGGVIRTGDGQTSSSVRDARLLPPLAQVTEVQFNRPYEIPAGKFVELAKLPALRKLDVSGSKIDARGLPFLREMKSIRVLSLAGLSVDNSFANDLPMGIEQLDVSGTDVGDFFLMDLKRFKELQHLDVRRTKVSREAVEKLRKALKGCKVVADPGL
jgi:WD40 repeat protein